MMQYILKLLVSAALIVAVSETAKRSSAWGGLLASLPLVSLISIGWLYLDTHDVMKVAALAKSTFWFVLPSLPLFLLLPALLQSGRSFALSMVIALAATAGSYLLMSLILSKAGVKL